MIAIKRYVLVAFFASIVLIFFTQRNFLTNVVHLHKQSMRIEGGIVVDSFCNPKTNGYWHEEYRDNNNTEWPWNTSATWKCPHYHFNQYTVHRRKANLDCSSGTPKVTYTMTDSPGDIQVVERHNACLLDYIRNCCYTDGNVVPNVMNYIWFSQNDVGFFTMVSFMSVIRFMRPCLVLFHGPYIPKGTYWNFLISMYPNVIMVNETMVTEAFGLKLKFKEHGSDVMRIKALMHNGGLYLDWDQVLVKPVEDLLKHKFTMSRETFKGLGNQFIMSEKNATFLTHWLNGYQNYTGVWAYNSIEYPSILAKQHPELINVLHFNGLKPPKERGGGSLWNTNSDWSNNYALHLYLRGFRRRAEVNMVTVRRENTTIGALCRRVLFGRKEMCEPPSV